MSCRRIVIATVAVFCGTLFPSAVRADDWPHWGEQDGRNMVSDERGLPDSFDPGQKDPHGGGIDLATTKNVKWTARLGTMTCSTPAVAGGRVFIGTALEGQGVESPARMRICPSRHRSREDASRRHLATHRGLTCGTAAVSGSRWQFPNDRSAVAFHLHE
jgi:hypothetical protein